MHGFFARYVPVRALHVCNVLALCCWCVLLFWFTHSYVLVTVGMAMIGLHYGMLHVYFLSAVVSQVSRLVSQVSR